ncbi:response regulator [Myxococcus stipitatus]|uniref:response regulator n=1 Tax=Myxococcus stipitatus TaxID=83455 RepID=UPI001F34FC12|nr:response regulator [Myxococcus stipitatus]MCE9667926.1 response regulator [Myxococcus stipitatus]
MGADRIKVLLVEDDGDSRELLAELLEFDFDVVTAEDGLAGFQAFERACPDVVVTDESLPGMSGTELARKVKQAAPRTRIILVSGYTEVAGAEHCDLMLRKPLDVERLNGEVGRLGAQARQWPGGAEEDARQ